MALEADGEPVVRMQKYAILATTILLLSAQTSAAAEPLALKGYDPVAYFAEGKPSPGKEQYQASFDYVRYWFASPQHRDLFAGDPERYAPQFAGSCTMGMAIGKKVEADPEAWLIRDEKLYVFFSPQARENFQQDPGRYLTEAERNWAAH
ncbi:MAG: hypothetical protein IPK78_02410 [Rhodospirillales bacterium]|nr:hypothetical protein [Rhodospirillales bacterium]